MSDKKRCEHNCHLCVYEWLGRCFGKYYGKDVSVDDTPVCEFYLYGGSEERLKEIEENGKNYLNLDKSSYYFLSLGLHHINYDYINDDIDINHNYTITIFSNELESGEISIQVSVNSKGAIIRNMNIIQHLNTISPIEIPMTYFRIKLEPTKSRDGKRILSIKVSCIDNYYQKV